MDLINNLKKSVLFNDLSENELRKMLEHISYAVREYDKGETIKNAGDEVNDLGIILSGTAAVQKTSMSGNSITISRLEAGQSFGEAVIFSRIRTYPAAVICVSRCSVFYLPNEYILKLFSVSSGFLKKYIALLSNRIIMLSRIIEDLTYRSIKEKIAGFLLSEYEKTGNNLFTVPYLRNEMADKLNVPRPSLSRELAKLKIAGYIDFHKNTFKLLDPGGLAGILK